MINRGIAGDRSIDMPLRAKFLLPKKPQILIIEGGVNDLAGGFDVDEVVESKAQLIEFCRGQGIGPILFTTVYVSRDLKGYVLPGAEVNSRITELNKKATVLAHARDSQVFDVKASIGNVDSMRPDITRDGIHFNDRGTVLFAKALNDALSLAK